MTNNAAAMTLPTMEADVVSLSANLNKVREEAVEAKAEFHTLCMASKFAAKDHNVA